MLNKKHFLSLLLICIFVLFKPCESIATAENKYYKAEACYKKLRNNPTKQKYRDNWLLCIKKFRAVYKHAPSGQWAAAGMFMSGKLYSELYKFSFKRSDKREALDLFKRIVKRFPKSGYKRKAQTAICAISPPKTKQTKPSASKTKYALKQKKAKKKEPKIKKVKFKKSVKASSTNNVEVTGLRLWSNPRYTRIVIDANAELSYKHKFLKQDPKINKPQRLYLDLKNSKLGDIKKVVPINDNLLVSARAAQNTPNSVRVVIDSKSFKTYKIFSLKNPFRIVIDVWGNGKTFNISQKDLNVASGTLTKQFSLCVRRIVIDPGHGGRDFGAPGYLRNVHEKDVVLNIAKKLAKKIRKKLKCEVVLTRTTDKYLALEERTAFANTKDADLFISIHTNASKSKNAYGIETYFLNLATDNDAILVAARENATSTKSISDLQTILNDLMQNTKINESSRLATYVQESLCKNMKRKYHKIKNKGVKQAPFYVLLGARMPSILIETSFISNMRECKRLVNSKYQDQLCEAIVSGIKKYIKETKYKG